jgi:hypothetical protein
MTDARRRRPLAAWPGAARVAVSFVLNYEEGGERNVLDGDAHAENYLVPEIVGLPPIAGHSRIVEDLFEYGNRTGFWRVLRLFEERGLHELVTSDGDACELRADRPFHPGRHRSSIWFCDVVFGG